MDRPTDQRREYFNTWRGLGEDDREKLGYEDYYEIFGFKNRSEFLEWIKDKEVLDLGSGYGGLTHDLHKMNFQSEGHVLSINPDFSNPKHKETLKDMIKATLSKTKHDGSLKSDEELNKEVDSYVANYFKKSIAAKWAGKFKNKKGGEEKYKLPFRDGVFDRVLCSYSFSFYSDLEEIPDALQDMIDILKPGGELRIVPIRIYENNSNDLEPRYELIVKTLKGMPGIKYELLPLANQLYNCLVVRKNKEEKV